MSAEEKEKLYIIGTGPGGESMFTDAAKDAMSAADRILITRRGVSLTAEGRGEELTLTELTAELRTPGSKPAKPKPAAPASAEPRVTAVLVSGDCGFFSAAKALVSEFSEIYDIELIPGIGSVQYLSARIKVPYDDAALVSLHGRHGKNVSIVPKAAYNKKVFALTGGSGNGVRDICRELCRCGLGGVSVSVGERLSYPDERITTRRASELQETEFDPLSVIYIENPSAVNPHAALRDSDFTRRPGVPMTKEEVRWLSIGKLDIAPGDVVFDIGAGTGSVSVEMARRAFGGLVYAVESDGEACALARENAARHGAFNIEFVLGEAPGALAGLPAPDKAFIGGSSGHIGAILEKLLSLNPDIRITANAVTLQTLNRLAEGCERHGIAVTDIICVNIAKAKKAGGYDMMTAQNPVWIITGGGHD